MSKSREKRPSEETVGSDTSASSESEVEASPATAVSTDEDESSGSSQAGDTAGAEDRVAELEAQVAELTDQLLRKQADFDNFRKRMFREREEASKYANAKLLTDLVEIIDNFERAIRSSEESRDFDSLHEGIELIEKQFLSMLENKYGLKRFESEGEEFDPEKHEAIAVEQDTDHDVQTVVEDYQKGYMLHDRVLRHAKVRVALPADEESATDDGGTDNTTE